MSVEQHRQASKQVQVRVAVVTVSDTRGPDDDPGGDLLADLIRTADLDVVSRHHVTDDRTAIRDTVAELVSSESADAIILTGGTGLSPRDQTPDAIAELFDYELPAFAALFAQLSYAEVGTAALLSRACAGVSNGVLIAALPGSPKAVRLAMQALLIPELRHMTAHLRGT